ncbi:MAG: ATP-binding protein [Spirulinaceae cyanobacterium SM2_1_0]|nr:ATP-binding protein [Spirulinaceae cyanobacterium SM2_1_0]
MKVQNLQLQYFKQFRGKTLNFTDPETGLAKDLLLLTGANGSGKSTVLQAIAAAVGTACGRLPNASTLDWPGFNWDVIDNNWGRFPAQIDLDLEFSSGEIEATRRFSAVVGGDREGWSLPAEQRIVSLRLEKPGDRAIAPAGREAMFQFKGRDYAKQLLRQEGFGVFEQVGTILWYTEQRTSTSLTSQDPEKELNFTEDLLRDRLSKWRQFHQSVQSGQIQALRPGQKDLYADIERAYQLVFPGKCFEGPVLREGVDEILEELWFYLFDRYRNCQYEISEMSGGERAIFPIVVDFANWNIHNSIILIDELELHLHPPLQQAFLRALPKLGQNNQFIITTHSDYVESLVPGSSIFRLDT